MNVVRFRCVCPVEYMRVNHVKNKKLVMTKRLIEKSSHGWRDKQLVKCSMRLLSLQLSLKSSFYSVFEEFHGIGIITFRSLYRHMLFLDCLSEEML